MPIREIAQYPEACLRKEADDVTIFDGALKNLAQDMADTMYDAPGIGLAGPQIRVMQKIFVLDISEDKSDLMVFINPKITASEGSQVYEEGCLSIPGIYEKVTRPEKITVTALNLEGKEFTTHADGLLAVCIQHELDHLYGRLFIDKLSRLKQGRALKKIDKNLKSN